MGKRRAESQGQMAAPEAEQPSPQSAPPPVASPASTVAGGMSPQDMQRLQELADLHKQGVLTDEEFAAQKARILS
jgi:hypothetical protein